MGNSKIKWISEITLGFIAFTIGCSFKREALKSVGKKVVVITLCEALGGAVITIGALFIAHIFLKDALPISIILTLGAIACATAPAATLMVIRQYKARGPVVDTLIPVVAFDDAVALIAFAILFSVSKSLAGGTNISVMEFLIVPIIGAMISINPSVSAQLCVLAFAFGDGFSNVLFPTNPVLLIGLNLNHMSYADYFKKVGLFQFAVFAVTVGLLIMGVYIGY